MEQNGFTEVSVFIITAEPLGFGQTKRVGYFLLRVHSWISLINHEHCFWVVLMYPATRHKWKVTNEKKKHPTIRNPQSQSATISFGGKFSGTGIILTRKRVWNAWQKYMNELGKYCQIGQNWAKCGNKYPLEIPHYAPNCLGWHKVLKDLGHFWLGYNYKDAGTPSEECSFLRGCEIAFTFYWSRLIYIFLQQGNRSLHRAK